MTVAGHPVHRSEFERSYNLNNCRGGIKKVSVAEFADLFVNYKLKVQAALDAHLDSLYLLGGDEVVLDKEARVVYQEMQQQVMKKGGAVKASQILIRLDQKATNQEEFRAKHRADSIYNALKNGANFETLAQKCSDDKETAVKGGHLPWIVKGQTVKAFEDAVFSMRVGEICKPVLTEFGYHIIRLEDRQNTIPYDALKTDICSEIDAKNIRMRVITAETKLQDYAKMETIEGKKMKKSVDDDLLVYEITNRQVWSRATQDEAVLREFFNKNKKRYKANKPYFKGKGKKLRKVPSDYTQVKSWVIADYQDQLEKEWVDRLRKKYIVVVNKDVLATVNK